MGESVGAHSGLRPRLERGRPGRRGDRRRARAPARGRRARRRRRLGRRDRGGGGEARTRSPPRPGSARAQTGYLYALREGYDFCAHLDADGQHPPAEVARLLEEVRADRADLVIGSRYREPGADGGDADGVSGDDYRPTLSRRIGSGVFRFFLTAGDRQRFTDTTSGMRAANRRRDGAVRRALLAGLRRDRVSAAGGSPRSFGSRRCRCGCWSGPRGLLFLTPLRSAFFIFKGMIVLLVGQFRPRRRQAGAELGPLDKARAER